MDKNADKRDYDRALADGGRAVQVMAEKLERQRKEWLRQIGWTVLAAGGRVEVEHGHMCYDPEVTIIDNPETGGFTITAKRAK